MNPPQPHEQSSWSHRYTDLVDGDVLDMLDKQASQFADFLLSIKHLSDHAYAPGKWTIKELAGHMIDTERVLVYRLMCFSRNEQQVLPGFDEDAYVANANFSERDMKDIADEFRALRKANMYLFRSFTEEALDRIGTSWQSKMSTRTLIYVCAGHVIHHTNIIKERYL
ncbi:MAG: DinB family protein [Pedobacter sp.]|nr:MAG: DinB family protein [Pedobacter sp.]